MIKCRDTLALRTATSKLFCTSVLDFNPHASKVTPQLLLGFVPLGEGRKDRATAALLDLSVKSNFLIKNESGTWSHAPDTKSRRFHSTGDRKYNECAMAGLNTMNDRLLSLK